MAKIRKVCKPDSPQKGRGGHGEEQVFRRADREGLGQVHAGTLIPQLTSTLGTSEATYCILQEKYGEMAVAKIRRLRQLEENSKLKEFLAEPTLNKIVLHEVLTNRPNTPRKLALRQGVIDQF